MAAMRTPISDQAAIVFSRTFYRGLVAGDPVDLAVTEARQAVHSMDPEGFEWATPVVFMRTPDGHLYAPPGRWYQNPKILILALIALIGLAGIVVPVVIGKDNEWEGWDPGTVVEINLQRGRITESLPFDVPFYLLSKPPGPFAPNLDPVAFLAASPRSAPICDENRLPTQFCGPYPTDRCLVPIAGSRKRAKRPKHRSRAPCASANSP